MARVLFWNAHPFPKSSRIFKIYLLQSSASARYGSRLNDSPWVLAGSSVFRPARESSDCSFQFRAELSRFTHRSRTRDTRSPVLDLCSAHLARSSMGRRWLERRKSHCIDWKNDPRRLRPSFSRIFVGIPGRICRPKSFFTQLN